MKFCSITAILVLFFSLIVGAQTTSQLIDSSRSYKTKDHAKALAFSNAAYKQAIANKETKLIGESALLLGVNNYLNANYDDALRWYFESEKIYSGIKDTTGLADLYSEMVIIYLKLKKFSKAHEVSAKAISCATVVRDTGKMANAFNNNGLIFLDEEKPDSAIASFRYGYAFYKTSDSKIGMSYSLDYLAAALVDNGKIDEALPYMNESKDLRMGMGDKTGAAIAISGIGQIYMRKKMPAEAIPYMKEAIELAHGINYLELEVYCRHKLAECYGMQGNYKEGYAALHNYVDMNDSLVEQQHIKETEELEAKYETNKKEARNILLTEQNKTQEARLNRNKIAIYALIMISLLIAGVFYLLYNRYKLGQQAKLKEVVMEEQRLRARDVLVAEENERKRIAGDLHDGVGQMMSAAKMNLSAIQNQLSFASEEQRLFFESAIKMVDDGCKEVRVISHNMMPNALLKAGLAAAIREFVNMIPDRVLRVQLHAEGLDEKLDKGTETVLYRVVQECVQNVIKHAQATTLDISLIKDNDGINIMVEDNGRGFDTSRVGNNDGLGTGNMLKRISYLKGTIEWSSTQGNGTLVSIHIPA
ncbi:MAG: degS 1 [Flavipsychrobacter sp.]|nr:degS 1 [Flavipsychrobacter sp.]